MNHQLKSILLSSFQLVFAIRNEDSIQPRRTMDVWCFVIILAIGVDVVAGLNDSKDLLLSLQEKNALDEFKTQVMGSLPEEFMKSDFYLIRWLRVSQLDLLKAKSRLFQTLKWRTDNKVSQLLQDDWADLEQDFPISSIETGDRPILSVELGDWDLRSAIFTGKHRRLEKYLIYATELGLRGILKAQKDGNNVTRSLILADMDGFSFQTHACPVCVSLLVGWVLTMETYYPNFIDEIIVVNSPSFGVAVVNTIKSFMSPQTRNLIKIFDHNKNVWIKYLDARIDRNQRPLRYGGTRTEN